MNITLIHIIIALLSVAVATYALLRPARATLYGSYALIAATVASGTVLVAVTPSVLIHACISGMVYTIAVTIMTFAAQNKLVRAH